ncbi:YcdB/YcdC domain-containing protein [Alkalicoccobacillus gibsonii]|uniref:YcdB/YcdC domain-containing protein n=1 Tax=Alkalicoccobacillus gibsonii TaxID=79881 RepID=UPI003512B4A3
MMNIVEQIQSFFPFKIGSTVNEWDPNQHEIMNTSTQEEVGVVTIDEQGRIVGFTRYDWGSDESISKEEVLAKSNSLLDTLFPNRTPVELSSILDMDDHYMVIFNQKDKTYGLFLHGTGYTFCLTTSGELISFYEEGQDFVIVDEVIQISEVQAKELYLKSVDFELAFKQLDREQYKNGDEQYHLTYHLIEHASDVPVNGSEPVSVREENQLEPDYVLFPSATDKTLLEQIGLLPEYTLIDSKITAGKRVDIWSKTKPLHSYSFDIDELDEDELAKIEWDEASGTLLRATFPEKPASDKTVQELSWDDALDIALQTLYKAYPSVEGHLKLEKQEEEIESYEEEDEYFLGPEPTYTFYFHYFHHGIKVDNHASYMDIGRSSGDIISLTFDLPSDDKLNQLPEKALLSKEEATDIFKQQFKMELTYVINDSDDEGNPIYSLSYLPSFTETVGYVRAIDATTGEYYFVDVGDAFFR